MGGIKTGGQYRHIDQIAQLLLFKGIDQRIPFRRWGPRADQRGFTFGQQAIDFFGVLYGGGKIITPRR